LCLFGAVAIIHRDIGPSLGQSESDGTANAARAAGDERDTFGQIWKKRHPTSHGGCDLQGAASKKADSTRYSSGSVVNSSG
jgi:hypothetical protein